MRPHLVHVQYPAEIIGFMAFTSWFELFGGATEGWDTLFAEETGYSQGKVREGIRDERERKAGWRREEGEK